MADTATPAPTIIEAAPVAGPTVAPPVTQTPAPVVATVPPPAVEATPAPAAATTPEPTPAKETETVLSEALKPVEPPKPTEPVADATKKESKEGDQSVEPAPPPSYDAFALPEGVSLDAERVKEFNNLLSELETSGKADHATVQAFGQKAVDFYINETKNVVETITKAYADTWEKTKTSWKDDFLKDPVIGGNKFETTVNHALNFIRTHGGTAEEQAEFRDLMNSTGLGNHKVMIRLLSNAGRIMAEGTPLAAPKPVTQSKSKLETMYGKSASS